jgi:hypothetical protein
MARKLKWRHDLHRITETVRRSKTETWTRIDLEDLFGVSRASAQSIMRAIGGIEPLGTLHTISRPSLLSYLEGLIQAEDIELAHRNRVQNFDPPPARKIISVSVPPELRSIMVSELPPEIYIGVGRVEVIGKNVEEIVERLVLLGLALQNDLPTAVDMLSPPKRSNNSVDADLRSLFDDLRAREAAHEAALAQATDSVGTPAA